MTYTARNWTVVDLPVGAVRSYPIAQSTSIPYDHVVAMMSQYAMELEKRGIENVFYTDIEQEAAGLDMNYGSAGLDQATEDFELPDGTLVKAGALVFTVSRIDMEAGTMTTLFEAL